MIEPIPEEAKALTFKIEFDTAQFKKHLLKLYRDTYLIPLPSSIAGIVGAILGIKKFNLRDWARQNELLAGALMLSYEGIVDEMMTVVKMKGWMGFLRTPKKNIILFRPKYKVAIASLNQELTKELEERIKNLDFEFEIFGGNDYNFVSWIGEIRKARLELSSEGHGYCKLEDLKEVEGMGTIHLDEVNDGTVSKYAFSQGVKMRLKEPRFTVNDGEHSIFVHHCWRFLRWD